MVGESGAALIGVRERSRGLRPDPQPTGAECEVIVLLSYGEAVSDIAAKFDCARHAMHTRIWRVRELFQVTTSAELVALALRRHWIE